MVSVIDVMMPIHAKIIPVDYFQRYYFPLHDIESRMMYFLCNIVGYRQY